MGVELGLEHADLRLVELSLVFHQLLLISLEGGYHAVEALGQLAQLVILVGGHIYVQVVLNHLADGAVQPLNGAEHLPAQAQAHKNGEGHAHQGAAAGDGGQQPPGVRRQGLGTLEHHIEPQLLLKGYPVGKAVPRLAQGGAGEQMLPQEGSQVVGQGGPGGIHRPPIGVEKEQIALAAVLALQKAAEVPAGHGDDQIARGLAIVIGDLSGALKEYRCVSLPAVHLGEGQPPSLPGGVEHPPVGGEGGLQRRAAGGVEAGALTVAQVKAGGGAAALGGAVQLAVYHAAGLLPAGQGGSHIGTGLQGQGSLAEARIQAVQAGRDTVQLPTALLVRLAVQPQAEHLQQHGRAQQHRHQRGHQKAHKESGAEGVRQLLHGSSPPPK